MTTTTHPSASLAVQHAIATWARGYVMRGMPTYARNLYDNHPDACWDSLTDDDRAAMGLEAVAP